MEIDVFPVVTPGVSLDVAFGIMTDWHRSAMVVDNGPVADARYVLVEAVDVVTAMAERRAKSLQGLEHRTPLRLVVPMDVGLTDFRFDRNLAHTAVDRYFEVSQDRFVLIAITNTRAVVVSRHEDDMPEQASPKNCYCTIDRKPVSPGKNNGDCPHDGRHFGSVRCR